MRGGKASSEHLMGLNFKQKPEGLAPKETDGSFPEDGVIKNRAYFLQNIRKILKILYAK